MHGSLHTFLRGTESLNPGLALAANGRCYYLQKVEILGGHQLCTLRNNVSKHRKCQEYKALCSSSTRPKTSHGEAMDIEQTQDSSQQEAQS